MLPPFDPETSPHALPEISGDLAAKEMYDRYGITKAAFQNRLHALPHVKGYKVGKLKFYTPRDVFEMDAAHHYLRSGYTLKDIAKSYAAFNQGVGVDGTTSVLEKTDEQEPEFINIRTIAEDENVQALSKVDPNTMVLVEAISTAVVQSVERLAPQPEKDPLKKHRLLKEAAESGYVLTGPTVAEILGVHRQTVSKNKVDFIRHGYRIFRVMKKGAWKVEKVNDDPGETPMAA